MSSAMEGNITAHPGYDYPPYKGDTSMFDYVVYFEDIEQMQRSWSDDPAFIPTVLTYSVAFVVGECD